MASSSDEMRLLAGALRAHVARRRALGERRSRAARAGARAEAPAATAAPAPARRAPAEVVLPARPPAGLPRSPAAVPAEARPAAPSPGQPAALAPACADLAALRRGVAACTACGLAATRTQTVFADGSGRARIMFVGEAPGFHEDAEGVPFVGKAGELLTDIITKGMGLPRADVYIANVLKCRPPDNRDPSPEEKHLCTPWLDRQIELVDPLVLVPLGRHAANHVLGTDSSLSKLRGRVHERGGRRIVPTFHPAYLLRNPASKRDCWADIQLAMGALGIPVPARKPDPAG